jgi:putative endonuclease
MFTSSTRQIGNNAEDLACEYLSKRGYKILDRNYTIRGGEIDIVASKSREIIFVEVKARYNHSFGLPIESITPWKIRALQKTAQFYLSQHKKLGIGYRFDLVSIDYADSFKDPKIEVVENIIEG